MRYPRNERNISNARALRKNMTPQERHLWYDFLRYCQPRFRRQELIGSYIADFFCYEANLVIEIDGSQHFTSEMIEKDNARTAYFHSLGLHVLRFDNGQINRDFNGVCQGIWLAMEHYAVNPSVTCGDSSPTGEP
ncbi:MAG: endonuclease domain-containing protein [Oscillospiraceae bacterium]|jgi:very-short-patch-repair endonuclease|nr:endonuclease domain-containing protein [Oscillospiraceae bacterium]